MNTAYHNLSDEAVVRAAVCGDRTAFDDIIRRYCRPLAAFARSRCKTVQDAEDIVQETFLRAFSSLADYDLAYPLKTWLFTIAYRLIISAYRRRQPISLSGESHHEPAANMPQDMPDNHWLWNIIQTLKTDDRTILWLRYKQEMASEEMARVLGVSHAAVRVKLHRARSRLIRQIDQNTDDTIPWTVRKAVCSERTHS